MARAHFVKKARKDIPDTDIKKGDSYYWWKFRYGGKHVSKTPPRPSQLTGSEFLSTVYAVQESLGDCSADDDRDDIKSCVEEVISELNNLKDETDGKLSNMPDSLQTGPTGELLQNRVDELDSMISELESIDLDDEDKPLEELVEELGNISYNGE